MTDHAHAVVIGAKRAFSGEIAARLRSDGFVVADRLDALPGDDALDLLVVDFTAAAPDIRFRALGDDDLRALLDDQLYGFVDAVQRALPRMAAGGAIVQLVSRAHLGGWGGVHVAASAAACVAMARSMALELAAAGIRVNCVATGPLGGAGDTPDARAEVAATVSWLGGRDSGGVTGETVLSDRGASLQMTQGMRR